MSLLISVIAGVISGFLINYFSDVLPVSRRITRPVCRACNQPYSIKGYMVSFKCSRCGERKSSRSILVLISAVVACILLIFFPFSTLGFWATLPILVFLGAVTVMDIEHRVFLFKAGLFGLALFSIYGLVLNGLSTTIAGAIGGFSIMLVFFILGIAFSKLAGFLRKQNVDEVAFGFGDVMAGTVLGLLAGWPSMAGAIIVATLAFGAYSFVLLSVLLITKKYRAFTSGLPFVPFLIFGVIVMFYL